MSIQITGGAGLAARLPSSCLDAARGAVEQLTLSVVEGADAIRLCGRAGFRRYGAEPKASRGASGYADEVLMVLFLEASTPHPIPRPDP